MKKTMDYYEETRFNMEMEDDYSIMNFSSDIIQTYGTFNKIKLNKRESYDYINDSINDAVRHFVKLDKRKRLFTNTPNRSTSLYFYNEDIVKTILSTLQRCNLKHNISFRILKNSDGGRTTCYEINFEEVLAKSKSEIF